MRRVPRILLAVGLPALALAGPGDFLPGNSTLPGPFVQAKPCPYANPNQCWTYLDANAFRDALNDVRTAAGGVPVVASGVTDDTASLQAAATVAGATREVWITSPVRIASAAGTISAAIHFAAGGELILAAGGSVTLSGPLTAPLSQIFDTSGGGTLTFSAKVAEVYPQWWGAKGDGVTDDTAAIQAAIGSGYGYIVTLPKGQYRIASGPLVVNPVPGNLQLPLIIRGAGFDGNGGSGGTYLEITGVTDGIRIINGGGGGPSLNNAILLEDFGIYGDGQNLPGGNGITVQGGVAGLFLKRLWIGQMRGYGVSSTQVWSALFEDLTVNSNRLGGIYVNQQANNLVIRRCKVLGNGKVYSQQTANIMFTGGVGTESFGAVIEATDWSYAGGQAFQRFKFSDATLTSIVVAGGTATVTTAAAHGLSTGNLVTINGATTAGFDSTYPCAVTVTGANTFTIAVGAANGTYTNATDPGLIVGPSAMGLFVTYVKGMKVIGAYAEDTADSAVYVGAGVTGLSIDGGYIQGQLLLVDAVTGGEVRGVHFALGQRGGSKNAGVYNNVTDFDISRTVTLDTGATYFQGAAVHKHDGAYDAAAIPAAGTWTAGTYVRNNAPAVGQPKGWVCTAGGTPGTWVSEGNL